MSDTGWISFASGAVAVQMMTDELTGKDKKIKESLVISESAIDFSRMDSGMQVLFNHDTNKPIGLVVENKIENGKLYARIRRGKDSFSEDVWKNIDAGIMQNTSIGYSVLKYAERNGVYYAERWRPYEISFVTVPADPTVGASRSNTKLLTRSFNMSDTHTETDEERKKREDEEAQKKTSEENERKKREEAEAERKKREDEDAQKKTGEENERKLRDSEAENVRHMLQLGQATGESALASEFVCQKRSFDELKTAIDAKRSQHTNKPIPIHTGGVTMSEKTAKRSLENLPGLSICDLTRSELHDYEKGLAATMKHYACKRSLEGLENNFVIEAANELSKRSANPFEAVDKTSIALLPLATRSETFLSVSGVDAGASAVAVQVLPEIIPALIPLSPFINLGCRRFSGLTADVRVPRDDGVTEFYVGADNQVLTTENSEKMDGILFHPEVFAGTTQITNTLMIQATPNILGYMVEKLYKVDSMYKANAIFAKLQAQILAALPADDIFKWIQKNTPDFATMQEMLSYIEEKYIYPSLASTGFLMPPRLKNKLSVIPAFANAVYPIGKELETKAEKTPMLKNGLTYLGDWSYAAMADFGAPRLTFDPYTRKKQDIIEVTLATYFDFNILRKEAFAVAQNNA